MPYDLRVKAAVGPTRAEVYATSSDAAEEWVESSDDTSNNTSRQASMSKQRRASRSSSSAVSLQGDSEGSESVVAVPPPLQRTQFSSLGELQEYLVDYEKATYQLSSLVPDEWGKRKRQQSRLLGCEAQINACVQVVDDSVPTFAVRITTVRLEHNHHLMDELRRAGAKKKSIMRYIQEKSGCVPNNQDVHNLVRKLKKQSDTAPTSAKRLRQWMIEFSAEPGNIGRIFVDKVQKKTVATCITLQTEHMRELFDRFPEVLMIDATHVSGKLDMILIQHNSDNEDALDEPRAEYSVNKRDWVCSCLFMSSRLLPCRHVFYLRKALNYENVIPTQLLNPRWLISTLRSKNDVVEFSGESFAMAPVMQEPNVVWDSNRKFREASAVTKTINEHLSGLGMREYKTAIRALHNIATLFKHGQFDVILDASEQRLECHGGELFGDTEFADALSENDSNSVVNEASAGVLEGADISHSVQPT
ncbi:hypothetical protein PF010_g24576 [Phytophthora fragariae]|uniref:SWIM-type domain-containing protein n=1 Tax=Phytophthora fragariae TaxID=53985 RepID=A0A6G0K329_9STRA|nr:hypothetical protein PF010_g24576 [Phytophthora fragariae]